MAWAPDVNSHITAVTVGTTIPSVPCWDSEVLESTPVALWVQGMNLGPCALFSCQL